MMIQARPSLCKQDASNASIKGRSDLVKTCSSNSMGAGLEKMGSNGTTISGPLSMDMFPEDLDLHGGLFSLQADSKRSINSSDFVKEAFLSDGLQLSIGGDISDGHILKDCDSSLVELTAALERMTTGDDIMEDNIRLSSSEWVKDFQDDTVIVGPLPQSMFHDSSSSIDNTTDDTFSGSSKDDKSSSQSKTKKRRERVIDLSTVCEPTDDDVLFGRGGFTNNSPGNIFFRQEALRLRPWYEQSSKELKYDISNLLLESVKGRGGRFLEKGSDGLWHEVIGNGARRKASQALRERINGR